MQSNKTNYLCSVGKKEPKIYIQSLQLSGPVSLERQIIESLLTVSVQDINEHDCFSDEMGEMKLTTVVCVSQIFERK